MISYSMPAATQYFKNHIKNKCAQMKKQIKISITTKLEVIWKEQRETEIVMKSMIPILTLKPTFILPKQIIGIA